MKHFKKWFHYLIKQKLNSQKQHNLGLLYFFVTTVIRHELEDYVSEAIIWYQKSNSICLL